MLDKNTKIFVAGHHGLVGSAIWNNLKQRGYNNLVGRTHKELDLLDPVAVKRFFDEERPEAVVLAAAQPLPVYRSQNHLYGVAPFVWPQPGAYQSQHHGWSQRPDDPQPEVCRRCGAQRRSAGLGRHRRMRVLCQ